MINLLTVFLEVSFNLDTQAEVGVLFFYISIFSLCVGAISILVALMISIFSSNSEKYKKPLKIGLILLLISGISLLLTTILCGWYN